MPPTSTAGQGRHSRIADDCLSPDMPYNSSDIGPAKGQRLLTACIDGISHEQPDRIWCLKPRSDTDLLQGFKEVTFGNLSNAINHASWWLLRVLGKAKTPFETFAFQSPNDLRIPILAMAAVKVERQVGDMDEELLFRFQY